MCSGEGAGEGGGVLLCTSLAVSARSVPRPKRDFDGLRNVVVARERAARLDTKTRP